MLVITEESYKITAWCREIADGLRQEARKKRINLTFSSDMEDIKEHGGENTVILVGAETDWLRLAVSYAQAAGKHPIVLSNQSDRVFGGGVSCVTEDLEGSMKEILDYFAQNGKKKLALYAVNPASASDACRRSAFLSLGGKNEDVFANEGSLASCFERFLERYRAEGYDGIVCVNDFAAISLLRHAKDTGEDLSKAELISYSDTLISRCSSPAVSSVRANYSDFGQMAFLILDCLGKSEVINGIRILGKWEIVHRETSSPTAHRKSGSPTFPSPPSDRGKFYADPELMEMMLLENLLSDCDTTDLEILSMILESKKHAEIESACFLTETAVKYRIRKMKERTRTDSREALRALFLKYISAPASLSALARKWDA